VCEALGSYLDEFRCVGESFYVFKPISRISKVKGCNKSNYIDHPHSKSQKLELLPATSAFAEN